MRQKGLHCFNILAAALMMSAVLTLSTVRGTSDEFEDLGTPVRTAALMAGVTGRDATGRQDIIYLSCAQTASGLLLLAVNPDTGKTTAYPSKAGPGAWAIEAGSDGSIYLGTWNGAHLLRFNPRQSAKGLVKVATPCPGETYIWALTSARDGRLYGCTYPNAKLFAYDPRTGKSTDFGSLDDTQQYARSIAAGADGKIYVGIGFGQANVVVYDPEYGTTRSILPQQYRRETIASVREGSDGLVYARCGSQWFQIANGVMHPVPETRLPRFDEMRLRDGRAVTTPPLPTSATSITVGAGGGKPARTLPLKYSGAGSRIFVVATGPDGKIYGSSYIPLQLFNFDPSSGATQLLGNPVPVDGQLYSLLSLGNRLYVAAYEIGAYVSVYDPKRPFKFGTAVDSNPRGLGGLGAGHMRPRAMIAGPQGNIYIGSQPPYGETGGSLAILDPTQNKVIGNYRNLVQNQGVVSLAYEHTSGLVFGGTDTAGGGGVTTREGDAHIFAFDPASRRKVADFIPVPGDRAVTAMAAANGSIFAVSIPSNTLTVYNTRRKKIIAQEVIRFGGIQEISLGLHKNGLIYGLAGNAVITIDPKTRQVKRQALFGGKITCGFALTDKYLYFGSNEKLIRYRL